jgi:anti-sigma regulatory factor (Ser/Thr protein kinase)
MTDDEDRFAAAVTVPGRVESVRPAASFLVGLSRNLQVPAADDNLFEVAIVEALSNALKHNRDAEGVLHCELELAGRCLRIRVLDEGARAPVALAIPTGAIPWSEATTDSWEAIPDNGYGLYLMRAVFPQIKPVTRDGRHGIEMELTF